ncbi:ribulose-phosphate 3-epimerase [Candidatus Dependentiae bacterium]|nr:ribulose-phosphate 3-epimerase [Candidatus Dependentiae bacterium]
MVSLFPSLISANLLNLEKDIQELEPYCAGFHIDVMDFAFVPNLTWGPAFIKAIRKKTSKKLWIHLMVEYPEKYLSVLELYPGDIVSLHIESPTHSSIAALARTLKSRNITPSIALNPETPLEALIYLPIKLEHILLMSVNPGFSGQHFLPHTLEKLQALHLFRQAHNLDFTIALDGGINKNNIQACVTYGANQLAVASAIFDAPNHIQALKILSF